MFKLFKKKTLTNKQALVKAIDSLAKTNPERFYLVEKDSHRSIRVVVGRTEFSYFHSMFRYSLFRRAIGIAEAVPINLISNSRESHNIKNLTKLYWEKVNWKTALKNREESLLFQEDLDNINDILLKSK